MKTNIEFRVFSVKEGCKEEIKSLSVDEKDVYQEALNAVNKEIGESIKALTGNNCLYLKEEIRGIAGGNSVLQVTVESPNFGDFLLTAKCCNGEDVVESHRDFTHEKFKDYNEFDKIIANATKLVLSEVFEKISERMYKSLGLDKGLETEIKLSKTKEDLDNNCILVITKMEFVEEC